MTEKGKKNVHENKNDNKSKVVEKNIAMKSKSINNGSDIINDRYEEKSILLLTIC